MSRAQEILWENREVIDQMMQQMDDFAQANGGYINRSGVGNFHTQKKVQEEEKAAKPAKMSRGRRQARAAGLAGAGLGAAYLAAKGGGPGTEVAKKGLSAAGKGISKAVQTAAQGDTVTGQALRGAGKAIKTAAKHYGIGG